MSLAMYFSVFGDQIIDLAVQHMILLGIALALAIVLGVGLGILIAKNRYFAPLVGVANTLQATPELVLLALVVPLLGIGIEAALAALLVKGVLPIMRNTYSGIATVNPEMREAAKGIGMTGLQILLRVELPVALPIIIAGVRVSAVMLASVLTLAAYIAVDSLGTLILRGIERMDTNALLVGSILTALVAIVLNFALLGLERVLAKRMS